MLWRGGIAALTVGMLELWFCIQGPLLRIYNDDIPILCLSEMLIQMYCQLAVASVHKEGEGRETA